MKWTSFALLMALGLGLVGCGDDEANAPPMFVDVPVELRVQANEEVRFDVVANDPDGDPVSLVMDAGPTGANFVVSGCGRFFWTPAPGDAETGGKAHTATYAAEDGKGGRTTFRTSIIVSPSLGGARFTTSNNRVLDLAREDSLRARVAVQADSLSNVPLTLGEGAPEGMTLTQSGPKEAELNWTPSADQVARKLIWGAEIQADVGDAQPVSQDVTVTLIAKSCGDGATSIQHPGLSDQRNLEDYVIEADVDSDGATEVTLFWRAGGDPSDQGGFEGLPMESAGGNKWRASIPNPLVQDEPVDIYYFMAASTAAERVTGCVARAPEKGLYSFAAFAPGDDSCRTDDFEPNDSPLDADELDADSDGVIEFDGIFEVYGLSLCEGDTDVFAGRLVQGLAAYVITTYDSGIGPMHLRGIGPDGSTVVSESNEDIADESSLIVTADEDGLYYIEVTGAPQSYRMFVSIADAGNAECVNTTLEPNESTEGAPNLEAGFYDDLQICPEDKDFFALTVPVGFALTARATFSHELGDLDLILRNREGTRAAAAVSNDDNEELIFYNDGNQTTFTLEVAGIGDNLSVPYSLELILEEVEVEVCEPDFLEPNDSPVEAQAFTLEDDLEDFGATMCGEDDFYAFEGRAGAQISANITFDANVADLDMEILDSNFSVLDQANTVAGMEEVSAEVRNDGLHYVRVFRNGFSGVPDYRINISLGDGPELPECEASDPGEPNNDRNSAALSPINERIENIGLCNGDEDWYFLQLSPNETLLAYLEGIPVGDTGNFLEEVRFELLDINGNVLTTGVEMGPEFEIQFTFINTESHFLRVTHFGSSSDGFIYDLDVAKF